MRNKALASHPFLSILLALMALFALKFMFPFFLAAGEVNRGALLLTSRALDEEVAVQKDTVIRAKSHFEQARKHQQRQAQGNLFNLI